MMLLFFLILLANSMPCTKVLSSPFPTFVASLTEEQRTGNISRICGDDETPTNYFVNITNPRDYYEIGALNSSMATVMLYFYDCNQTTSFDHVMCSLFNSAKKAHKSLSDYEGNIWGYDPDMPEDQFMASKIIMTIGAVEPQEPIPTKPTTFEEMRRAQQHNYADLKFLFNFVYNNSHHFVNAFRNVSAVVGNITAETKHIRRGFNRLRKTPIAVEWFPNGNHYVSAKFYSLLINHHADIYSNSNGVMDLLEKVHTNPFLTSDRHSKGWANIAKSPPDKRCLNLLSTDPLEALGQVFMWLQQGLFPAKNNTNSTLGISVNSTLYCNRGFPYLPDPNKGCYMKTLCLLGKIKVWDNDFNPFDGYQCYKYLNPYVYARGAIYILLSDTLLPVVKQHVGWDPFFGFAVYNASGQFCNTIKPFNTSIYFNTSAPRSCKTKTPPNLYVCMVFNSVNLLLATSLLALLSFTMGFCVDVCTKVSEKMDEDDKLVLEEQAVLGSHPPENPHQRRERFKE